MNEILLSNRRRKGMFGSGIKKQTQSSPPAAGVAAARIPLPSPRDDATL